MQNKQIYQGDVFEQMKNYPADSIDCIVTSPPYWALRDYGVKGQIGSEPDFRDYLKIMQKFMVECKKILKPTGTCWINLGDTYSTGKGGLQPKTRMGIPERFYTQCIDEGWIARNNIPWIKGNCMPSSVKDRFTNKYEPVFFFAKDLQYYFNLDAVRAPTTTKSKPFNRRVRDTKAGKGQAILTGMAEWEKEAYNKKGERTGRGGNNPKLNNRNFMPSKQDNVRGADGKIKKTYAGFNKRWNEKFETGKWREHYDEEGNCLGCGESWRKHTVSARAKGSMHEASKRTEDIVWCNVRGKNPGDVLFINTRPYKQAHFATFPIDLPLFILKCACPKQVCKKCGEPRYPIPDSEEFTKCSCDKGFRPGIVLDPFFGSGTTALAADQLGLWWTGIELSKEYIEIARERLKLKEQL